MSELVCKHYLLPPFPLEVIPQDGTFSWETHIVVKIFFLFWKSGTLLMSLSFVTFTHVKKRLGNL